MNDPVVRPINLAPPAELTVAAVPPLVVARADTLKLAERLEQEQLREQEAPEQQPPPARAQAEAEAEAGADGEAEADAAPPTGASPAPQPFNPSTVTLISHAELEGRDPDAVTVFGLPLWGAVAIGGGLVALGVVAASDSDDDGGGSTAQAPRILSNGGGDTASVDRAENTTAVTTVVSLGSGISYSITGGVDADLFDINSSTGALTFKTAPDFETPTDDDGDNQYVVEVQASNGSQTDTQTITVTVGNVAEITSDGGGDTADLSVVENTTAVTTVVTEETDDTLSFSIVGGDDQALFNINATTGALRFLDAPDFENPGDSDTDNVYEVIVRVSGASGTDSQTLTITVTDDGAESQALRQDDAIAKALNGLNAETPIDALQFADGTTMSLQAPAASLDAGGAASPESGAIALFESPWLTDGL